MEWAFAAGELLLAKDLRAALEPAARRFRAWEVTGEGAFGSEEGCAALRAMLPSFAFSVSYHGAFRGVDLASPDDAARARDVARLTSQLGLARSLGAHAMVVHPGARIKGVPDAGAYARSLASLRALARAAHGEGIEVRVENMPRGPELAQMPQELAGLARGAGIAACWDVGHERTLGAPPDLAPVAPFAREAHVHDNRGTNDDHGPLTERSAWLVPRLAELRGAERWTVEHRTVAECLASRDAARALLGE
ncbi:MAG: sugar phosphate isomerase/epimerase [Halobacteriales archaeon]|nr:sugar phosphate isomerase/epimerase [Halobacteriales archaeon]